MFFNLLIIDMVRTRGAYVHHGDASSSHVEALKQEPKCRPMILARKRGKDRHGDGGPSAHGEAGSSTAHGETAPSSPTPADIHVV